LATLHEHAHARPAAESTALHTHTGWLSALLEREDKHPHSSAPAPDTSSKLDLMPHVAHGSLSLAGPGPVSSSALLSLSNASDLFDLRPPAPPPRLRPTELA
jgi:hypothetical protein